MADVDTTSPEFLAAVAAAAEAKAKELIEAQMKPDGAMAKAIADFMAKHDAATAEQLKALDARIAALKGQPPRGDDRQREDDKGGGGKLEPWQIEVDDMRDFETYRRVRAEADRHGRDVEVVQDGKKIVRMERQQDLPTKVRILSVLDARDPEKYAAARAEADKAGEELRVEDAANG